MMLPSGAREGERRRVSNIQAVGIFNERPTARGYRVKRL